jgi:SAM-dependent methyltransferase
MLTGLAARASLWNRRRKLELFLDELRPEAQTTIVDVGVGDTGFSTEPGVASSHNFFEAMYPWPERITAVSDVPLPNFAQEFPAITCVTASGTDLPFDDDSFDIAFSNAVLEHVGRREEQRRFVAELCRVASRVFVSTPNRLFPIEVHTLLPLAHWLPRRARDRVFAGLRRDAWKGVDLLSRRELVALFPEHLAVRVLESRMTISVVATRTGRLSVSDRSK